MRTFALFIAALLLTSACTDDPEPIEPSTAPSASEPAQPTIPSNAKEDTPSGAANFVAYWVSTFNYGARTGDVDAMLEHAGDCEPCRSYATDFKKLRPSDRADGPVWKLSNVSVTADRTPIEVSADVKIEDEAGTSRLVFVLNKRAPFKLRDIYKSKS